jgi:hypothetical protein
MKFHRPFHAEGVSRGVRIAGRVLLCVWWLALAAGAALALYLGRLGFI